MQRTIAMLHAYLSGTRRTHGSSSACGSGRCCPGHSSESGGAIDTKYASIVPLSSARATRSRLDYCRRTASARCSEGSATIASLTAVSTYRVATIAAIASITAVSAAKKEVIVAVSAIPTFASGSSIGRATASSFTTGSGRTRRATRASRSSVLTVSALRISAISTCASVSAPRAANEAIGSISAVATRPAVRGEARVPFVSILSRTVRGHHGRTFRSISNQHRPTAAPISAVPQCCEVPVHSGARVPASPAHQSRSAGALSGSEDAAVENDLAAGPTVAAHSGGPAAAT